MLIVLAIGVAVCWFIRAELRARERDRRAHPAVEATDRARVLVRRARGHARGARRFEADGMPAMAENARTLGLDDTRQAREAIRLARRYVDG